MNSSKSYNIREELKTPLHGHVSQETAYIDEFYDLGMRAGFAIGPKRYWIERGDCLPGTRKAGRDKVGERLVTQTSIPKKNNSVWNGPKRYIYNWVECLYLKHDGHVDSYGFHRKTFNIVQVKTMKELFFSVLDEHQKHIIEGLLDMYGRKALLNAIKR